MKAATRLFATATSALLFLAGIALPLSVHAGPNANASLVLHLAEPTVVDPCLANSPIPGCQSLQTMLPYLETPVFAYILVERGNIDAGIGGAHFGMQLTPGFQVFSWSLCADEQTATGWPASGGGLTVSWDSDNSLNGRGRGAPSPHSALRWYTFGPGDSG